MCLMRFRNTITLSCFGANFPIEGFSITIKLMRFGTSKAKYSVGLVHPSLPDLNYVFFRRTFGITLPNNGWMVSRFHLVDVGGNSDNNLPCSLSMVSVSFVLLLAVVSRLAGLTSLLCLVLSITVVQMDPKSGIPSG